MRKIVLIFLLFSLSCSPLEISRVAGIGTRPFKTQGKVHKKILNTDFFSTYERVKDDFIKMGAQLYRGSREKAFIIATNFDSVFKQCSSSTEVAVFFKELSAGRTEVEISSLNYSLADFIADKLFNGIPGDY